MNIMHDTQKCSVMFEGYDTEVLVSFDDVEQYEVCIINLHDFSDDCSLLFSLGRIL